MATGLERGVGVFRPGAARRWTAPGGRAGGPAPGRPVGAANVQACRMGVPMRAVAAGWILVMAHPGLWIPVTSGDCGLQRVQSGLVFTALAAAIGIWGMFRAQQTGHDDSDRSPRP